MQLLKKNIKAICFNSGKFSSIGQPESIAAVQNRHNTSIVSPIRDVYVGVVSSCDPALDCALAGFPHVESCSSVLLKECTFMRGKCSVPRESYACVSAHKALWCGCLWESVWTTSASWSRGTPHVCVCVCVNMENLWKWRWEFPATHSSTQDHCERSTPFKDKIKGLCVQNEFDLWHQSNIKL